MQNSTLTNVVLNLGIKVDRHFICYISNISDLIEKAIKKYQIYPDIIFIKKGC